MRVRLASAVFVVSALLAAGRAAADVIEVPAGAPWTPTAVELSPGQAFRIEADGRAAVVRLTAADALFGADYDRVVGPAGTYVWPRDYARRTVRRGAGQRPSRHDPRWRGSADSRGAVGFPLLAADEGPHPAFGLIGRIGPDGPPFWVGARYDGRADRAGRLWLGLNDTDCSDNRGAFRVVVSLDPPAPATPAERPRLAPRADGSPVPKARVLLLYVDGLRPDVVEAMAAGGYLPHIRRVFLDGGLAVPHAFTTFPSNTLTANGALFTGLWPDRTGIKSQNQFERTTLVPRGQRSEWFADWWSAKPRPPRVYDLLDKFAPENTYRFLRDRGVATLDVYLGLSYRYTVLPIAPMNPPPRWLHQALNAVRNPFAAARQIPGDLDRVNARYLIEEVLSDPEARVTAAWFPMVDHVSHHTPHGQFGSARRDLALFDRALGRIMARLRHFGLQDRTYLILVSDHGFLGGEAAPNRRANLAQELFHRQLGCNVRVVGRTWRHPGHDPDRFVFLDHQAWGQAAIFLPKGEYQGGPWLPNTLSTLSRYRLGPNRGAVDLVRALLDFTGPEWAPGLPHPVDLVLVKLDAGRVLVTRGPDRQALIEREEGPDGTERYRYRPVRRAAQSADGMVAWDVAEGADPFGYLTDPTVTAAVHPRAAADWIAEVHTAQEWLAATARTEYPDAVVGIAKFFHWAPPVEALAQARDPDLVVTAARGWSFRSADEHGTDHGAPLAEATRISLYLAGPNIRRGVLEEPHRIIDVLPTILDMVRHAVPDDLDGRPIRGIYE